MIKTEQRLPETPEAESHVLDFQGIDPGTSPTEVNCLSLASEIISH